MSSAWRGQITLSAALRRRLDLKGGDVVILEDRGNEIVLTQAGRGSGSSALQRRASRRVGRRRRVGGRRAGPADREARPAEPMRLFLDANVLFTAAHNPDGKADTHTFLFRFRHPGQHLPARGSQTVFLPAAARLVGDGEFQQVHSKVFLDGPLEVAGSSGIAACGEKLPPRGRLRRTRPENGDLPVLKRSSIFLMGLMGLLSLIMGLVMGLMGLVMGLLSLLMGLLAS